MLEYGYTIEDIDKALSDYIKSQNITVMIEGTNIRLKLLLSSPEDIYGKKTVPCLNLESGYKIETPHSWITQDSTEVIMEDLTNKEVTEEISTVYYSYKIGYYVTDPRHDVALTQRFLNLFPTKMLFDFEKALDNGETEHYSLMFIKEPRTIKMDNYLDGMKIYRKDIIITTTLHFTHRYTKEFMRMKGFELQLL